jgi:sulfur carrier protein ThiS
LTFQKEQKGSSMKTIEILEPQTNEDVIQRVTDFTAEKLVASREAKYIPKSRWKTEVRDKTA